jgi:hypothetical protein
VKWAGELPAAACFFGAFSGASDVAGDAVSALADYDRRPAVAQHVSHGSILSPGSNSGWFCSGVGFCGRFALVGERAGWASSKNAPSFGGTSPRFSRKGPRRARSPSLRSRPAAFPTCGRSCNSGTVWHMKKQQLLDLLTTSLGGLPDDAVVGLGQATVTIPFDLYGVPYALIRISAGEVDSVRLKPPAV